MSAKPTPANVKSSSVKFKLDPKNPPPLTTAQHERLKAVATMSDAEIDYSDMPDRKSVV